MKKTHATPATIFTDAPEANMDAGNNVLREEI